MTTGTTESVFPLLCIQCIPWFGEKDEQKKPAFITKAGFFTFQQWKRTDRKLLFRLGSPFGSLERVNLHSRNNEFRFPVCCKITDT